MIVLGPALALLALWLLGALALSLAGARRDEGLEMLVTDLVAGIIALATLGMTTIALGGRIAVTHVYLLLLLLATLSLWRRRARRNHGMPRAASKRWQPARMGATEHDAPVPLSEYAPIASSPAPTPPRDAAGSTRGHVNGSAGSGITRNTLPARTLLAGACLLLLLLAISASQDRLAWDGWAFWTLKARILFFEGTLPPTALDPEGAYPYAHPDYPLAIPLLDWWLYRHAGTPAPALASLAGVLWFATLTPLVWTALRERVGETTAALATLGTAAFWPLAFYATGGYADIAIALAILGTIIELDRMRPGDRWPGPRMEEGNGQFNSMEGHEKPGGGDEPERKLHLLNQGRAEPGSTSTPPRAASAATHLAGPDTGAATRLALYLTLGALAKNEGLALALIGATVALASGLRSDRRRTRHYVVLTIPFLALAPWYLMTRGLGLVPQHLEGAAPALGEALVRIPTIATALGKLILSRAWIPLPFLVLAALYAALRHRRLAMPAGWAIIAGYGTAIGGVYLTTTLDLDWLLRTTLDRMVGDLVPAIVVLALWEIWREQEAPATPD